MLIMASQTNRTEEQSDAYRLRMLVSIVASQLFILAIVLCWPRINLPANENLVYNTDGQDLIPVLEIQPTRQAQKPPPPPAPLIPISVEDDIIIEEEIEFEDTFLVLEEYAENLFDDTAAATTMGNNATSKAPERGPKEMRFVEPEWPRAARRKRIRADVIVEVLVDEKGLVREAKVVDRYMYEGETDQKAKVSELKYGLEEAAVEAAKRWMFQPARQDGNPVKSYKKITFSFGK